MTIKKIEIAMQQQQQEEIKQKNISTHSISIDFSWLTDDGIEVVFWLFEFIYATIWVVKIESNYFFLEHEKAWNQKFLSLSLLLSLPFSIRLSLFISVCESAKYFLKTICTTFSNSMCTAPYSLFHQTTALFKVKSIHSLLFMVTLFPSSRKFMYI